MHLNISIFIVEFGVVLLFTRKTRELITKIISSRHRRVDWSHSASLYFFYPVFFTAIMGWFSFSISYYRQTNNTGKHTYTVTQSTLNPSRPLFIRNDEMIRCNAFSLYIWVSNAWPYLRCFYVADILYRKKSYPLPLFRKKAITCEIGRLLYDFSTGNWNYISQTNSGMKNIWIDKKIVHI